MPQTRVRRQKKKVKKGVHQTQKKGTQVAVIIDQRRTQRRGGAQGRQHPQRPPHEPGNPPPRGGGGGGGGGGGYGPYPPHPPVPSYGLGGGHSVTVVRDSGGSRGGGADLGTLRDAIAAQNTLLTTALRAQREHTEASLNTHLDGVNTLVGGALGRLGAHLGAVDTRLGAHLGAVDTRLGAHLGTVDTRLREHRTGVRADLQDHLNATHRWLDGLGQEMGLRAQPTMVNAHTQARPEVAHAESLTDPYVAPLGAEALGGGGGGAVDAGDGGAMPSDGGDGQVAVANPPVTPATQPVDHNDDIQAPDGLSDNDSLGSSDGADRGGGILGTLAGMLGMKPNIEEPDQGEEKQEGGVPGLAATIPADVQDKINYLLEYGHLLTSQKKDVEDKEGYRRRLEDWGKTSNGRATITKRHKALKAHVDNLYKTGNLPADVRDRTRSSGPPEPGLYGL